MKPRDYEPDGEVDAVNFYDAWAILRGSSRSLDIGDVLESESGETRVCKYVGFEEARWVQPEVKSEVDGPALSDSAAATSAA